MALPRDRVTPPMGGLTAGTVTRLDVDGPCVELPRVAAGFEFGPLLSVAGDLAVTDQVLVGFLDGNPDTPVVLGRVGGQRLHRAPEPGRTVLRMDLISHPFRLDLDGAVATVLDGTSEANTEAVAVLALTVKGERDFVPTFGITDPTFLGYDSAELNAGLATFGPEGITVTGIEQTYPDDATLAAVINFED